MQQQFTDTWPVSNYQIIPHGDTGTRVLTTCPESLCEALQQATSCLSFYPFHYHSTQRTTVITGYDTMQVVLHQSELADVIFTLFVSYTPDVIRTLGAHRRRVRSLASVCGKLSPIFAVSSVDQACITHSAASYRETCDISNR